MLKKKGASEHLILQNAFSEWIEIKKPKNQHFIKVLEKIHIHSGEASIITLGKELQKTGQYNVIIIDDLSAREIARTLDLNLTGTIGIIMRSMHLKLIPKKKCRELIQSLIQNTTFRISAEIFVKVLNEIEDF